MIKSFTQIENIDFHKIFASTLRFESLRLLLALINFLDLLIHQLDIDNIYLNIDLNEEVYLIFSLRLTITSSIINKVLRLRKELYKLKQLVRI